MNSLQDLNNFGNQSLDYIDQRSSGVKFDRQYPLTAQDQDITINSTLVYPQPGINIIEIINYQTANVRYRVTIRPGIANPLVGSSITFPPLPSGITLSQSGNEYTLSGIKTPAHWETIKNYTWTLPIDYASYPLWYLDVDIIYYDSSLNQDVVMNWIVYDDRYFYVTEMTATANMLVYGGVNSPASVSLTASAVVVSESRNFIRYEAPLTATAVIVCEGSVNVNYLNATATMSVNTNVVYSPTVPLTASAQVASQGVISVTNLIPKSYIANRGNNFFVTNTPQIDTTNSNDTFSITISSSLGYFTLGNDSLPTGSVTITGTKTEINTKLISINPATTGIYFYPTKNSYANGTFTWAQSRNGTLEFTRTISLTGIWSEIPITTLTFTSGQQSWKPSMDQVYYARADILVVGGGGQGSISGGGGGGQVKFTSNVNLSYETYTIAIGKGGKSFNVTALDTITSTSMKITLENSHGFTNFLTPIVINNTTNTAVENGPFDPPYNLIQAVKLDDPYQTNILNYSLISPVGLGSYWTNNITLYLIGAYSYNTFAKDSSLSYNYQGQDGGQTTFQNNSLSINIVSNGGSGGKGLFTRTGTNRYSINVSGGDSPGTVINGTAGGSKTGAVVTQTNQSSGSGLDSRAGGGGAGVITNGVAAVGSTTAPNGGDGWQWTGSFGNNEYYGGGGGGGQGSPHPSGGAGGLGGGGWGTGYISNITNRPGRNGTVNTGGGGGGGWGSSSNPKDRIPGNGGSGVVVIKFHG